MNGLPKWFGHVNLNARDLERTERFYSAVLELRPVLRMNTEADQSGAAFEIDGPVRWTGTLMSDDRGARGPILDVLEWTPAAPEPSGDGRPVDRWGLNTLMFSAPDLESVAARVAELQLPADFVQVSDDGDSTVAVHARDPDGTHIEVRRADGPPRFCGVRLNCSSLERSTSFYERVLRMEVAASHRSSIDGRQYGRNILRYPGNRDTFDLELCEPDPAVLLARALRPGNRPGLYRMALVTADFDASLEHLASILAEPLRVAKVDIGAGVGMLDAVFFEDPDGAVVEFVEHGFVEVAKRQGQSAELET